MLVLIVSAVLVAQLILGIGTLCLLDRLIGEVNFTSRISADILRLLQDRVSALDFSPITTTKSSRVDGPKA